LYVFSGKRSRRQLVTPAESYRLTQILKIITGRESDASTTEALGALAEYYRAFNGRNMELLELNWIDSDEASISGPLGGQQRGWKSISRVYDELFRLKAKPNIELHEITIQENGVTFLCVGRELIRFQRGEIVFEVSARSSRWFTHSYGRWRQVHYHGSIDNADQLHEFQSWAHAESELAIRTVDRLELSTAPRLG
jgi:SnoaL-like domain